MNIYLASKSPRRRELLKQMEVEFELLPIDIPEKHLSHETAEAYSKRITHDKLTAAWNFVIEHQLPPKPVLCADTEVVFNQHILGKPKDAQHAIDMLKSLSGNQHEVITSVGLQYFNHQQVRMNKTIVHFSPIPNKAIEYYVSTKDYQDKAGGYGIQSSIAQFINKIDGCFYSVMGLPLNTVRELLYEIMALSQSDAKSQSTRK